MGGHGAAYVFDLSGGVWTQTQKLTGSDGAEDDFFGWSVSLSGDRALIGATQYYFNVDQGAAYVFDLSGDVWAQTQKLTALDGAADYSFGSSVSLSGNRALVGDPRADINGMDRQGAAFVFHSDENQVPTAVADTFTINRGETITGNVLSNDWDGDNDTLTAVLDASASHGSLQLNANGNFIYSHDDSRNEDSFTYHVSDGKDNSSSVKVSFFFPKLPFIMLLLTD